MDAFADVTTPYADYGLQVGPRVATPTALNAVPSPALGAAAAGRVWSPSSPMFWFAAVILVAFGAAAVSTTVRVGPARVSAGVGKA
jgi:hypothetical protein